MDIRRKSVEMLANALRSGSTSDEELLQNAEDLACGIEEKLYEVHQGTGEKYKAALRSHVFNLRDKKNPGLRQNVLAGEIPPEQFAEMTADEMASEELKEMRHKLVKETIEEHKLSIDEGTPSDMFRCEKCGGRNCSYSEGTQIVRSSDEASTTYIYCRDCGDHRKSEEGMCS
ncbi:transcription factor s-II (TFIIS), central domain-containing protein [Ditylenchus destructor]|uniref:Transcription factor s-II (TFIIS), central domain-containing protein n=1 Tax=Ditylenchus destructor TaxID=166010 RepID=A0AAD4RC95_9BILA|nr:transcription factor s-II (TFIIS), central domain-containing protein [Ditylenchus destructor]